MVFLHRILFCIVGVSFTLGNGSLGMGTPRNCKIFVDIMQIFDQNFHLTKRCPTLLNLPDQQFVSRHLPDNLGLPGIEEPGHQK